MKKYETLFVVDGTLESDVIDGVAKKFTDLIANTGENVEINTWGKRKLAYEVNKKWDGFYVLVTFDADNELLVELERQFRLDEKLMKFLITKVDEKKVALGKEIALKKAEEAKKRAEARQKADAEAAARVEARMKAAEEAKAAAEAKANEEASAADEASTTEEVSATETTEE